MALKRQHLLTQLKINMSNKVSSYSDDTTVVESPRAVTVGTYLKDTAQTL